MLKKIKNLMIETIDSLKNFKNNPIYNLGIITPCLIVVVQIIHAIVSYITFLINEGYSSQLNLHSAKGNIEGLFGGPFVFIIALLFFAEVIFTLISYYRNTDGENKRKVVKILSYIFAIVLFVFLVFLFMIVINFVPLEAIDRIIKIKTIFYVYLAIELILFIIFSIFMIICLDTRKLYFYTIIALVFSFVILPLLLLLLEHIITIAIGILIIVAFIIMFSIATGAGASSTPRFKITDNSGNVVAKNEGGDFVDKEGNVIAKFLKK